MSPTLIWQITAVVGLPCVVAAILYLGRGVRWLFPAARLRCARCRYDRSRSLGAACPECGLPDEGQRRKRTRRVVRSFSAGAVALALAAFVTTHALRSQRGDWTDFIPTTGWAMVATRPSADQALRVLLARAKADRTWWWQRDYLLMAAMRKIRSGTPTEADTAMRLFEAVLRFQPRTLDAQEWTTLAGRVRAVPIDTRDNLALTVLERHGETLPTATLLESLALHHPPGPIGTDWIGASLVWLARRPWPTNDDGLQAAEFALFALRDGGPEPIAALKFTGMFTGPEMFTPELIARLRELAESDDLMQSMLAMMALAAGAASIDEHAARAERAVDEAIRTGDPLLSQAAWFVARCGVHPDLRLRVMEHLLDAESPMPLNALVILENQPDWAAQEAPRLHMLVRRAFERKPNHGPFTEHDLVAAIERGQARGGRPHRTDQVGPAGKR